MIINTRKHLAFVLKVQQYEFDRIVKNIDKYYYEKEENKTDEYGNPKLDKKGGPQKRIFNPSINRLKQIQERILKNILLKLKLPNYAYGSVRKRDNVQNAKKHQGKKYKFKTDLRDFFPSINNKRVFNMFCSFNFSPTVSRILTQLTTYKGRLPQGAPTSSAIANLTFVKTGKKLQKFSEENCIIFTSFVDDLCFSSPFNFKNKTREIIDIIKSDGFRISHTKTQYRTKTLITGIYPSQNSIDLPDSFKNKLKRLNGKSSTQVKGLREYEEKVKRINRKNSTPKDRGEKLERNSF